MFGFSFIKDIERLLALNGLSAPIRRASKLPDQERINLVIRHIDADEPVLIAIGNGHLSRHHYSAWARHLLGHFLTVYGYDREKRLFFVYDSYLIGDYEGTLPAGNDVRSFDEFLRDWKGPFYYRCIGMDHIYFAVKDAKSHQ